MLSQKQRKEFIKDSRNLRRRQDFAKVRSHLEGAVSLDAYIHFLMGIQRISPFRISRRKTVTVLNKL